MRSSCRNRRARAGRCTFCLEGLESRDLLSAGLPGIVATQPADQQHLASSPQELAIKFNQSDINTIDNELANLFGVSPDQAFPLLVSLDSNSDIELDQVNSDGTTTQLFGPANPPAQETVTTITNSTGTTTGTELVVPMQVLDSTGQPENLTLQPGTYQISVESGTNLAYVFSGLYPQSAWSSTQPVPVAQFTILGSGATLQGATKLGTIGTTVQTVSGTLTPDDFRAAVDLYKINLAPGHFWDLGLAVSAQSIGSPLQADLTLFDAQGKVLATSNSGTGLANDPNDPYLFEGLPPGTYYVGVSGAGNRPNVTGGYNPVTGIPGTAGIKQPGGPFQFQLNLLAQPDDTPPSLVGFNLNYADPLSSSPTGISLLFSRTIDVSPLFVPDQQQTALEVVDSSGQVWPLTALDYQVAQARLNLVFNQALPAGTYTLLVPAQGGLTDLAGVPVVGPGTHSAVLARWTVASPRRAPSPNDLGPLWPGIGNPTWNSSDTSDLETENLAPGQGVTYRFVTLYSGLYKVQTLSVQGQVAVQILSSSGVVVLSAGNSSESVDQLVNLTPGIYGLRLINVGTQSAVIQWALEPAPVDWDKIMDNGIGQQSALSLMLITPLSSSGSDSSHDITSSSPVETTGAGAPSLAETVGSAAYGAEPGPSDAAVTLGSLGPEAALPPGSLGPDSTAASNFVSSDSSGTPGLAGAAPATTGLGPINAAPIPANLLVSLNTGLIGLPQANAEQVEVAGPTAGSGLVALADSGRGLMPGIGYPSAMGMDQPPGAPDLVAVTEPSGLASVQVSEQTELAALGTGSETGTIRADERALARAGWLVRLGSMVKDWITVGPRGDSPDRPPIEGPLVAAVVPVVRVPRLRSGGAADSSSRAESRVQADAGASLSLIVATAVAYQIRQPIQKWWQSRRVLPHPRQPGRFPGHGPHFPNLVRSRTTRRSRPMSRVS
jgi:hypothetical protein